MGPSDPKPTSDRERAIRLEHARACYAKQAWAQAYDILVALDRDASIDQTPPLAIEDLERLACAAALTGRPDDLLKTNERVYRAALEVGDKHRAARAAYWSGIRLQALGETGRASAWFARCERMAEGESVDGAEWAYALLPLVSKSLVLGDLDAAHDAAARVAAIAERFGDADALAFARNMQGRALMRLGRIPDGIALLDESMLAATTGELTPVVAAIIYCSVIASCHRVYALDRAREWTSVLSGWCDAQPELVTFRGICMVHRAEILQLGGEWSQAIDQARRASAGAPGAQDTDAAGDAHYQEGEIHRLRGDVEAAETSYRTASQLGREPQPGLALLRLAHGQRDAAASGIRRLLSETKDPLSRVRLLPAAVEILIAVDALDEARSASRELEETATRFDTEALGAIAAHARAMVHLAEGDAQAALGPLRRAFWVWQKIGAPHAMATARVGLARACEALGDHEGSMLELDAARSVFARLGAAPDLAALEASKRPPHQGSHGLTPRELEVLRLVAAGKTNKSIAKELFLSEKTVDRHLSNIFTKVNVSSRAAATAFAYENGLI